jgi:prephenate dehydrogenase
MTVKMTIIGLGKYGTSIGLALADEKKQLERIGHDRDIQALTQAEKRGAIDKKHRNLFDSIEDADIVVLATPTEEVKETLELIAKDLKDECVVVDISANKGKVTAWAEQLLPEKVYFVSMSLGLNPECLYDAETGYEAAREDLFKKGTAYITATDTTSSEAIQLISNLAILLGARPFFSDAIEYDSQISATHLLPQLAAAALVRATTSQNGWQEGRKIASENYTKAAAPIRDLDDRTSLGFTTLLNREHVLRNLDLYIESLKELRGLIEKEDAEKLDELLDNTKTRHSKWWEDRQKAEWFIGEPDARSEIPSAGDMWKSWLGFGNLKKKK